MAYVLNAENFNRSVDPFLKFSSRPLTPSSFNPQTKLVITTTTKIAPTSVWFTKQFPREKWVEFIRNISSTLNVFFLGAKNDYAFCDEIISSVKNPAIKSVNLAGKLSITETAALMKNAVMNFVNDSAPLHIASAVNAPVTAIFCSTIPEFGFGPLSDKSFIVAMRKNLYCRPCGIHGYNHCPEGHFRCAYDIDVKELLEKIS